MVRVVAGVKQWIKSGLMAWQQRKYDRLLEEKTVTYDGWIRKVEKEVQKEIQKEVQEEAQKGIRKEIRKEIQKEVQKKAQEEVQKRAPKEAQKKEDRRAEAGKTGSDMSVDVHPLTCRQVPYEICKDYLISEAMRTDTADVVLFTAGDGKASEFAEEMAADYFRKNDKIVIAYGDEDVMGPDGIRYTPWLKPHWSPDTFLSFFYFGSIFAVRTNALRELTEEEMKWIWEDGTGRHGRAIQAEKESGNRNRSREEGIYRLCYILAVKSGGFLPRDGKADEKEEPFAFPIGHMDEILFHASGNKEIELLRSKPLDRNGCPVTAGRGAGEDGRKQGKHRLSVVIPSKDNVGVLKRCIESVQRQYGECRNALDCEIIVVDNGSRDEVRKELENWLAGQEGKTDRSGKSATEREMGDGIRYRYLYREMPFHFSKMCNIGAEAASGDVLLFLNDDVEVGEKKDAGRQENGMREECLLVQLYHKAKCSHTGAVGVKLYYPDSRRIQHSGIVNLRLGPVHKLQFKEDDTDYYYGWNRRARNVIAVTGACLAVEKEKYREAGGFPEELPVAFNDVDFCFSLFERGYYQVVLQDVVLYHYESMSRGNDDSREKLKRLLGEKDKLYARHPRMYGTDPFYHKYLASDMLSTGFELRSDYDSRPQRAYGKLIQEYGLAEHAREDACVMISLEYAGAVEDFFGAGACEKTADGGRQSEIYAGENGKAYLLQGYSFVTGSDNACYEKHLIFQREQGETDSRDGGTGEADNGIFSVWAEPMIRRDVEANLPDQVHVGMTGFCLLLGKGDLPEGSCRIGMMVRDKCTGQELYAWTNRYLETDV